MFKLFFVSFLLFVNSNYARAEDARFSSWDEACQTATTVAQEGDLIFLDVPVTLFRKVAESTGSWTSHVGVVLKKDGQWVVAESKIPLSTVTPLCSFIKRSSKYLFEIKRLHRALTLEEIGKLHETADQLQGRFYHTGFDFDSKRLFCSKFAYLVYQSIGVEVGHLQTFRELLAERPATSLSFWNFWFFGSIPWDRRTVTPASQLNDPKFLSVLKGLSAPTHKYSD